MILKMANFKLHGCCCVERMYLKSLKWFQLQLYAYLLSYIVLKIQVPLNYAWTVLVSNTMLLTAFC